MIRAVKDVKRQAGIGCKSSAAIGPVVAINFAKTLVNPNAAPAKIGGNIVAVDI